MIRLSLRLVMQPPGPAWTTSEASRRSHLLRHSLRVDAPDIDIRETYSLYSLPVSRRTLCHFDIVRLVRAPSRARHTEANFYSSRSEDSFPLRFADDSPDSPLEGAGFELLKSPRLHQQIDDLDKVKPRFA